MSLVTFNVAPANPAMAVRYSINYLPLLMLIDIHPFQLLIRPSCQMRSQILFMYFIKTPYMIQMAKKIEVVQIEHHKLRFAIFTSRFPK